MTLDLESRQQWTQFAIVVSTLGVVMCLIGLYPGITGVEPQQGIGVLQILIILFGMLLIISGAMLFVKIGFYANVRSTLMQRIAVRLSLTGLLFSAASGLADVLGYGSNPPDSVELVPVLGIYQAWGMVIGFIVAAFGVVMFGMANTAPPDEAS
jgi:hypothetical protein